MGMADFPAKVRAKLSRHSPARTPSPLHHVEPAPQRPQPEPEPGPDTRGPQQHQQHQQHQQRRRNRHSWGSWSTWSRGAAASLTGTHPRPSSHFRHALATSTMETGESSAAAAAEVAGETSSDAQNSRDGRGDSDHTTAQRGGNSPSPHQSRVGSDRRDVVLSTTPSPTPSPRETDDLDDQEHRQHRQPPPHPPLRDHEAEALRPDDAREDDSLRTEPGSRPSLFRPESDQTTSKFFPASSPEHPLPSPTRDLYLDPTSPSAAQSPERYRQTRAALAEYEAEDEVRPDSNPRPLPSRGPSLAGNSNNNSPPASQSRPHTLARKQSLLPQQSQELIRSLLGPGDDAATPSGEPSASFPAYDDDAGPSMGHRKVWVKRPNASATLVTVREDHLVDDVRDMILRKYANTLGRSFDSPDVTLRVIPRENRQERTLGPEEPICQVLDGFFPGGQTVDEALVIDVPLRRTPKPSPQPAAPLGRYYQEEERRPQEPASEYFPPMPIPTAPSPHLPASHSSMSVLTTGHVPNLPSPGRRQHHRGDRPRVPRQHTASPAVMTGQPQLPQQHSDKSGPPPPAPPLPSPPAPQQNGLTQIPQAAPPPRISSPRPPNPQNRPKKPKKSNSEHPSFPAGMLNGAVPPINVLIVEDNIINLKLLEAFMKRLKVRSQNAMNGREAVTKWRTGGFHLVLMDIQLPIMNGLDATKEIRRLERLNSIGVFTSSAGSSAPPETIPDEAQGDDKLNNLNLFKSPVIIVALTASSLQSDRHEALAAGCNDFLTKPVNFVWLERKVMEWGCMQALIDYDGWRQWKDFSQEDDQKESKKSTGAGASGGKKKKHRPSAGSSPSASTSHISTKDLTEPVGLGVDSGETTRTPSH